jgi:hypothetical protein
MMTTDVDLHALLLFKDKNHHLVGGDDMTVQPFGCDFPHLMSWLS